MAETDGNNRKPRSEEARSATIKTINSRSPSIDMDTLDSECESGDFAEPRRLIKRKNASSVVSSVESLATTPKTTAEEPPNPFKLKKRRIQDETNPTVTHPSGRNDRMQHPSTTNIVNKFSKLNSKNTLPRDMDASPKAAEEKKGQAEPKPNRPPPIVVHGQFDGMATINGLLKTKLSGPFHWRNTPNSSGLYLANRQDWEACKEMLRENSVEFHTFSMKEDKNHAFVLRGLFQEVDVGDIMAEIKEQDIPVKEVFRMKGTRYPAYLVVTSAETTIKRIEAVRYISYTKVRWERHYNSKMIIQCHRCQAWGHATANCNAVPKCLKCAATHLTRDCTKDPNLPAKCVNCGGAHPANNTTCSVYQRKIADIERGRGNYVPPDPKMRYVAAPPPARNAWTKVNHAGPSFSVEEYPPLKAPSSQPHRQEQRPTTAPDRSPRSAPAPQPAAAQEEPGSRFQKFKNIENQYKRLQGLIDLDLMLGRITTLNDRLESCRTEAERFETFFSFMSSLNYA